MIDKPNEILRAARIAAGFESAADAARHYRWVVPTYQGHENGTRGISKRAAERYGKVFHIDARKLLGFTGVAFVEQASVAKLFARPAQLGVWSESTVDNALVSVGNNAVYIPAGADGMRLIKVTDEHASRLIGKDDIAVIRELTPGEHVEDGKFVLVERDRGGLTEVTIRRVEGGGKRLLLWSKNPKMNGELTYPSAAPGETVRIVAVLTAIQVQLP